MTLNRLGSPSQEHRPLTPYERGQMLTHYPTVGPTEMARRLHRSISSIKYHWAEIRPKKPEIQVENVSDFSTMAA